MSDTATSDIRQFRWCFLEGFLLRVGKIAFMNGNLDTFPVERDSDNFLARRREKNGLCLLA